MRVVPFVRNPKLILLVVIADYAYCFCVVFHSKISLLYVAKKIQNFFCNLSDCPTKYHICPRPPFYRTYNRFEGQNIAIQWNGGSPHLEVENESYIGPAKGC